MALPVAAPVEGDARPLDPGDGLRVDLDRDACYRALRTRDRRFDGRFYTGVVSTGIYCRPICPAPIPRLENCVFLPSAGAAHQLGFRPCLRCRPEAAPGSAGWQGTAGTVSRALHLIAEGGLADAGVEELAERLGIGDRQLRRLFDRYVGASPISVAQAHRILFAKKLLGETALSMTEVALASGFGSVRRFNDALHKTYGRSPTALRKTRPRQTPVATGVRLKLPFSPPYDWRAMIAFLGTRAMAGVERVEADLYERTFAIGPVRGVVQVQPADSESHLVATIHTGDVSGLATVVARLRRLFDLDVDIAAVDAHLARDRRLASHVRKRPGVRVPGAWDGFELAVRAILGQQITVAGARTMVGRLVAACGEALSPEVRDEGASDGPDRLFPVPSALAGADLTSLGLTRSRAATLRGLAAAMEADPDLLRPCETLEETLAKLAVLPGVGPWTAQYIAMRALREPDAFPASDLGLLRAMATTAGRPAPASLARRAEAWRPWRAYAAMRLWIQG
jgi:AraC family transcriptional regulator, regulatory protein of adaptative response / DNA-3-methyladenine glycosylase II